MDDDWNDDLDGEVRAVSAAVLYDGSIAVMLRVPGHDELVSHTLPGDEHTLLMCWTASRPIDLAVATAADRRCQEIVARGVARLNADLARNRDRQQRLRVEHQRAEDELHV